MKRILDILGDLRIAFWLLLAAGAVMWVGSLYAAGDYGLFNSLNGVRLQDWFIDRGWGVMGHVWWIVLLFAVFTLLAINTAACTVRRIIALLPRQSEMPAKRFAVLLSPSVIHLLFMGMLAGHFFSFTAITQDRAPAREGERIELAGAGEIAIKSIRHRHYAQKSLLADRIEQSTVEIEYLDRGQKRGAVLEFLRPVVLSGMVLHLDMVKIKKTGEPVIPPPEEETCNKAENYRYGKKKPGVKPQLYIVSTSDPGLYVLIPGFVLVILVMGWYFYQIGFGAEKGRQ